MSGRVHRIVAVLVLVATAGLPSQSVAGVQSKATGSGHMTFEGAFRNFAFTAREYSNDTVKGRMQLKNRASGVMLHAKLDCLEIFGQVAVMSGVATGSNFPELEGAVVLFAVEDNGEGVNAPPDRITEVFLDEPPPIPGLCELAGPPPEFLLAPIEKGNVQVHEAA